MPSFDDSPLKIAVFRPRRFQKPARSKFSFIVAVPQAESVSLMGYFARAHAAITITAAAG